MCRNSERKRKNGCCVTVTRGVRSEDENRERERELISCWTAEMGFSEGWFTVLAGGEEECG